MAEIHHPHDAFFKQFLSKPEIAADFLHHQLPADVVALLDLPALKLQKDSFIDGELQEHFSDLLYRVPTKTGASANVYLLFEHKSYPDQWVVFQILRYMVRIWEKELAETHQISPIIPLVVYHGRVKWNISTNFSALFTVARREISPDLRKYLPEFSYELADLSAISDEEIRGEIWSRVFQLILKHIFDENLGERLPGILMLTHELAQHTSGLEMVATILRYVSRTSQVVSREDLRKTVTALFPKDGGSLMPTLAQEWLEEGKALGLKEGIERGIEQGIERGIEQGIEQGIERGIEQGVQAQRSLLLHILQRRFKPSEQELEGLGAQLAQIKDLKELTQLGYHALDAVVLADFLTQLKTYTPK